MTLTQAKSNHAKSIARKRNYRLTPRDLTILHFIGRNGFATGRDIGRKFFEDGSKSSYLRRLGKLRVMGMLAPLRGDHDAYLGYITTRLARERLREEGIVITPGRVAGRFKSSYGHDLMLQRIRETLEQSHLVSQFRSESELRSEAAKRKGRPLSSEDLIKVPDGCFMLKCPSHTLSIALELELATKTQRRYRKMLRALCTIPNHDCVFILSGKDGTMKRLEELLKEVRAKDPFVKCFPDYRGIYFGLASELLAKGQDAKFYGEGKTFTLNELAAG